MDKDVQKASVAPSARAYKCCKSKLTGAVVCILCDELYHTSCLNRKKGIKYISNALVTCCRDKLRLKSTEEGETVESENESSASDLRRVLASIKTKVAVLNKKRKALKKELKCLKTDRNTTGDSTSEDSADSDEEVLLLKERYKHLSEKNKLLVSLNDAMKEKNQLLIDKNEMLQGKIVDMQKAAEAVVSRDAVKMFECVPGATSKQVLNPNRSLKMIHDVRIKNYNSVSEANEDNNEPGKAVHQMRGTNRIPPKLMTETLLSDLPLPKTCKDSATANPNISEDSTECTTSVQIAPERCDIKPTKPTKFTSVEQDHANSVRIAHKTNTGATPKLSSIERVSFPHQKLNSVREDFACEANDDHTKLVAVAQASGHTNETEARSIAESKHSAGSLTNTLRVPLADYPSKPEDKATYTNNVGTEKDDIEPKISTKLSSVEQVMSFDQPLKGARENVLKKHSSLLQDHTNSVTTEHEQRDTNTAKPPQPIPTRPVGRVSPNRSNPIVQQTVIRPNQNATRIDSDRPSSRSLVPQTVARPNQNVTRIDSDFPSYPSSVTATLAPSQGERLRAEIQSLVDSTSYGQIQTDPRRNTTINILNCQPRDMNDWVGRMFDGVSFMPSPTRTYSSSGSSGGSLGSGYCGAMTQKGTPCRNKPSYGGPRCWRH